MTNRHNNAGFDSAANELSELGPLRELSEEVRMYPVRLLVQLCDLHEQRGGPVPDHVLQFQPYLGETALRALVEGGYAERKDDVSYAIHAYVPTDKGIELATAARS